MEVQKSKKLASIDRWVDFAVRPCFDIKTEVQAISVNHWVPHRAHMLYMYLIILSWYEVLVMLDHKDTTRTNGAVNATLR